MSVSMFTSLKENRRLATIDLLKLFASVLVILSHSMMKYIDNGTSNPLFNFIWLTQMPLFMFASGFVNIKKENYSSIRKYLAKELKNALILLIPCLTFLLITSVIQEKSIVLSFRDFFFDPQSNLWFLWALFVIRLIFDFGLFLSNFVKGFFSILLPVLITCSLSFLIMATMFIPNNSFNYSILAIKLISYYIPFYCLGYLTHLLILSKFFDKKIVRIISYVFISFCLCILVFECLYFKSIHSFDDFNIFYLIIRVLGSVSSIFVLLFLFDLIVKNRLISKISTFGAYSLQTYYLHIVYLKILDFSADSILHQWLLSFSISLLLIAMVAITLIAIYFVPFLHLVLFGKSFSYYKFERKLPNILR